MVDGMSWFSPRKGSSRPETIGAASHIHEQRTPVVKVALVGNGQVGKTSLMVQFMEGMFDEHHQQQAQGEGVNFMQKTVRLDSHEITFSIWDMGSQKDSASDTLPLLFNDAVAILFVFDLTRHDSLDGIREWHRQARCLNKCAMPVLVGTKYDLLLSSTPGAHTYDLLRTLGDLPTPAASPAACFKRRSSIAACFRHRRARPHGVDGPEVRRRDRRPPHILRGVRPDQCD